MTEQGFGNVSGWGNLAQASLGTSVFPNRRGKEVNKVTPEPADKWHAASTAVLAVGWNTGRTRDQYA